VQLNHRQLDDMGTGALNRSIGSLPVLHQRMRMIIPPYRKT
jgi:hypothetical protein